MRVAVLLAILFMSLMVFETSFLWVFLGWFSAIPVMTIAGLLVMQRVGVAEGTAWFLALAFMRGDLIACVIALIGPFLVLRVFSTRSLYALFGTGIVAFGAGIVSVFVVRTVLGLFFDLSSWHIVYRTLLLQEALLVPGLFVGLYLVRWFEQNISSRIALKSLS